MKRKCSNCGRVEPLRLVRAEVYAEPLGWTQVQARVTDHATVNLTLCPECSAPFRDVLKVSAG